MDVEFICLCKLGVGAVLVRHSDIITMELTPMEYTRIEFGYGEHLIVEETPLQILTKIKAAQELTELTSNEQTTSKDTKS